MVLVSTLYAFNVADVASGSGACRRDDTPVAVCMSVRANGFAAKNQKPRKEIVLVIS